MLVMNRIKDFGINPHIYQRLEEFMRETNLLTNIETFKKQSFCGIHGGTLGEIAGEIIRNSYLRLMEQMSQRSSTDSIVNEILNNNNNNSIILNNSVNSIRSISNNSVSSSGSSSSNKNKHENHNNDVHEFEKILNNFMNESNIYKTYVEIYRFIGQKINPIIVQN